MLQRRPLELRFFRKAGFDIEINLRASFLARLTLAGQRGARHRGAGQMGAGRMPAIRPHRSPSRSGDRPPLILPVQRHTTRLRRPRPGQRGSRG
jgi:hypothetical protein